MFLPLRRRDIESFFRFSNSTFRLFLHVHLHVHEQASRPLTPTFFRYGRLAKASGSSLQASVHLHINVHEYPLTPISYLLSPTPSCSAQRASSEGGSACGLQPVARSLQQPYL